MQVAIYLRSDVDWQNIDCDNYRDQPGHAPNATADFLARFYAVSAIWDQTYALDMLTYRGMLRELAWKSLGRVRDVDLITTSFETLQQLRWDSAPTWVVPIDDDDWLAPYLPEYIRDCDPLQYHCIEWDIVRFLATPCLRDGEQGINQLGAIYQPARDGQDWFHTNMYAVSNGGIAAVKEFSKQAVLSHHERAAALLQESHTNLVITTIKEPLAVTYKSPASLTRLWGIKTQENLIHCIEHLSVTADGRELWNLPAWSLPYYEEADDLLRELRESRYEL